MNTKYIISLTTLIALSGAQCRGAANNSSPETSIGSLARLYAEGPADLAPRILASLYRKDLLQLAVIGHKESQRFPMLYQDAMRELFNQKEKFRQLLKKNYGNVQAALLDATRNDKPWAIDYLVENVADVDTKNKYDITALMLAAAKGHEAIVAQLICARADVHAHDNESRTALMWATGYGYGAIVAQLIAAGADVNAKDNKGWTALIEAVQKGYAAIVAQLIAAGADVNTKTINGNTAVIEAALNGHVDVVDQLIAARADVNVKNDHGSTALIFAAIRGYPSIAKLLIKAEARD